MLIKNIVSLVKEYPLVRPKIRVSKAANVDTEWIPYLRYNEESGKGKNLKSLAEKENSPLRVVKLDVTDDGSVKDAIESPRSWNHSKYQFCHGNYRWFSWGLRLC